MALKNLGATLALLSAMEQEWLSTYPNLDPKEVRMARALLRVAQSRLQKYTQS